MCPLSSTAWIGVVGNMVHGQGINLNVYELRVPDAEVGEKGVACSVR